MKQVAAKFKRDINQLYQIFGKKTSRPISDSVAREFERLFDLPVGWMDTPYTQSANNLKAMYNSIPIAWNQIADFKNNAFANIYNCRYFRVEVTTSCMEESENIDPWYCIPFGSEIVVDTELTAGNRQLVVYQKTPDSEPDIGQLIIKGGQRQIKVFNEAATNQVIPLTEDSLINGVIRQVITTKTLLPVE